ncbi:hypothetical protein GLOTRDRAFT_120304 [Gloeophyllum trabeum ATCC 11539]|uniref:Uncharacterized protein n=1 Tax=Gloeophyllum trabeum (strain ATCC 11539 / FP-39264 / Madison 617) TaxID=670483 RepID=S7RVA1_GLOTA|nr:uncharacterized protein GLOTRDRAFT_120304 [Gloeophyllum trabeum ATCC 11539]EPQ58705.1 hypothetical protein GLOTRDRAFT_120304 [Gloeophyllum trabeum ATCC 11539]
MPPVITLARAAGARLHRTREVPKIDGSEGGFIGLVVGLCVIIVICCAAVFYLLTYHQPSPADRARRRQQRSFHHRRQSSSGSMHSFKEKLTGLFTRSGQSPAPAFGLAKRGQGWVQAGSGDEWESDSGDERQPSRRTMNDMERGSTRRDSPPPNHTSASASHHPPPIASSESSSATTVELAAPTPVRPFAQVHVDPFASRGRSPSPQSTDSFQSTTSSPTSPVRTFEGGTKFKEHL